MKRILTIVTIFIAGVTALLWARTREASLTSLTRTLKSTQVELQSNLVVDEARQIALRDALARPAPTAPVSVPIQFSPALAEWLAAGDFSNVPAALVPELRAALGLAGDTSSDYVLISKPTMETLRPRSPGKSDKLSDNFCALLSIAPEQRAGIETALSGARKEFADWARQNVVRETPGGEAVVRYTLPAATDFADGVTNRLLSAISGAIGPERASLFRTYAETWFQIEMGYLGGVTNTLAVLRQPGDDGQEVLLYKLSRVGEHSSMSEGPGKINPRYFPPAWRNIFPGGWAEVAQREGLQLPAEPKPGSN